MEFEPDVDALIQKALAVIDTKREALGLAEYDPDRFGASGDRVMEEVLAGCRGDGPLNVYSTAR
jgi:hypothetical protein